MLEEFMGVPTHPLLVHIPVVLVPVLALLVAAYALVPLVRPHTRYALALLAVVTPIAAWLTTLSGKELFDRGLERGDITPDFVPRIEDHQSLGNWTLYSTIALGVLTLALVYLVAPRVAATAAASSASSTSNSRVLSLVVGGLSIVAAGVSLYFVIRTGDSGAKNVWEGR